MSTLENSETFERILQLKETDPIVRPPHYNAASTQPLDIMLDHFGPDAVRWFCVCNGLKYVLRHQHKGGLEDLKKAAFYLRFATGDDPREPKP